MWLEFIFLLMSIYSLRYVQAKTTLSHCYILSLAHQESRMNAQVQRNSYSRLHVFILMNCPETSL